MVLTIISKPSCFTIVYNFLSVLLARDAIYTSRAYATMSMSVRLSVCDGSASAHYS